MRAGALFDSHKAPGNDLDKPRRVPNLTLAATPKAHKVAGRLTGPRSLTWEGLGLDSEQHETKRPAAELQHLTGGAASLIREGHR